MLASAVVLRSLKSSTMTDISSYHEPPETIHEMGFGSMGMTLGILRYLKREAGPRAQ